MRKKDELSLENTCMGHAHPEEMVFVLLGRDSAAPVAIRAWVAERLRLGKNVETDAQVTDALSIAETMELEGRRWVGVCAHARTTRGENSPLRYGSKRTQVCSDCRMFRTHGHNTDPDRPTPGFPVSAWRPASEYAGEISTDEDA
jgi:hypothetical protein